MSFMMSSKYCILFVCVLLFYMCFVDTQARNKPSKGAVWCTFTLVPLATVTPSNSPCLLGDVWEIKF